MIASQKTIYLQAEQEDCGQNIYSPFSLKSCGSILLSTLWSTLMMVTCFHKIWSTCLLHPGNNNFVSVMWLV